MLSQALTSDSALWGWEGDRVSCPELRDVGKSASLLES